MTFRTCCSLLLCLLFAAAVLAQDFRASLSGVLTDPTGAAIPGATVRILREGMDVPTEVKTNQEGFYTLPFLNPGTYSVEASAAGFQTSRRSEVVLLTAEKRDLPFRLALAQSTTTVDVVASAEQLQTADASGGTNFDSVETAEYALNGRQAYMLMDLAPGVLFTQEQFGTTGFSGTRGWDVTGAYVMNGGVAGTNQFLLNGAPVSLTGAWQVSPNVEAIQEFKVMTNTYDARYGRTGGGTINTTLKSGTNRFHGSVFEYFRNSVLDANTTQNNSAGAARGKHITHQFGGVIGGPIRKDKDFFFLSYEGFREVVPFPSVQSVPAADLRDGRHFSNYRIQVYDPLTTAGASFIRAPFPDNVLPESRISPIGRNILALWPAPNMPGEIENYVTNNQSRIAYDQPMTRWDHQFSSASRLSFTSSFQHGTAYRPTNAMPPPVAVGNINQERQPQHYILNYNRILTTTAIFDLRASFGRYTDFNPNGDLESDLTPQSVGIKNMPFAPTAKANFAPKFSLGADYVTVVGAGYNWSTQNQWTLSPSFTLVRGRNTIHLGGEVTYAGLGNGNTGSSNGEFVFARTWTQRRGNQAGNRYDGSSIADLLLGLPGNAFVDWNDTYYRTWPYVAGFVQSDWKLRSNLTLNLGLRYDVQIPFVERWNRQNAGYDFNAVNPLSDRILANWRELKARYDATKPAFPYPDPPSAILGGKTFVDPSKGRRVFDTDWTDIQPRVGLAWNFQPRTVLRGGFGIYYRTATGTGYIDGFSQRTSYVGGDDTGTYVPRGGLTGPYSLENPFPDGLVRPTGPELGLLTNVGNAVNMDTRRRFIPRTYQYSFGLQQMFPWGFLIDASYVGSQTVHDAMQTQVYIPAEIYRQGRATPTLLSRAVPNPYYGILPAASTLGSAATTAAVNLNRTVPLHSGFYIYGNPWGKYRYDSLQLRAQRRMFGDRSKTGALTAVFSYTFSKSFEANHRLNNFNLSEAPMHELSAQDKPQMISFSGVWDLPFGKNRRLMADAAAPVRAVVSGWNFNWVYTFRSGYPVAKPNAVFSCGSYIVSPQAPERWFNNDITCYSARPQYTLRDTEDRFGNIRNPDASQLNITLARTFRVREKYSLQLRGEAFNVTNTPQFGAPDTSYTSPRFGMLPLEQRNFPRLIQIAAKVLF